MTSPIATPPSDLTPTQEAMLLYALYAPESPAYFEQFSYSYRGPLDIVALAASWQRVIDRHAILRTSFRWNDQGGARQVVHERVTLPFSFVDLSELDDTTTEQRLASFLEADRQRGFDLSAAPLLRLSVIKTGERSFEIVISNHHLVLDGWSMGLVRGEVSQIYQAITGGKEIELPAAPDFQNFVTWLAEKDEREAETFWRNQLHDFTELNVLPFDSAPGHLPATDEKFDEQSIALPEELVGRLQSYARRHRVTLSTLMQSAWALLLSRYSNSRDVLFGITVSGRPYDFPEIDSMVGLLINTLPLRVQLTADDLTVSSFLHQVQANVAEMLEHETTSLTKIQEWRDVPHHNLPLFESLIVFENFPGHDSALKLDGEIELRQSHLARTNYPLTLVINLQRGITVGAVYHHSRFKSGAVENLLNHFALILRRFAESPDQAISAISLLTDRERQTLTGPWSESAPAATNVTPVHRTIEAHAAGNPHAIAIEHEGRQLTYAELNARANQLARYLQAEGVRAESLVGICLERSIDMIVSVLAVLKAGGAYVPLDPVYPAERLGFMLDDSGAQVLLGRENLRPNLPDFRGCLIAIDAESEAIAQQETDNLIDGPGLHSLAYVIYTSGSTGKPKGVMIEHLALANFVAGASAEYAISPADRVLQFASLSFDTSVEEIYCALFSGATLVLRTEEMLTSSAQFLATCEELRISVLDLPTGYWHHLTASICADDLKLPDNVQLVLIGGEAAHPDQVTRWRSRTRSEVRLINTYGPTEGTVVTTTFDLFGYCPGAQVAIGRPLRGAKVYVLDRSQQLVPAGLPGELYIGGPGVARGYLNQPELTAQKFVANPFGPGRLYRSGDMVRFSPDGNLESLGRVDNQVKIRGFRIELEEVEQAIRSCMGISDAVVIVHEDADGDKRLSAYLTLDPATRRSTNDVRSFIKRTLPAHMIPASWTILDSLPLMPNGKVDRRALPAPDHNRAEVEADFISPRTPTEEVLGQIWCAVLKFDRIGVHDNFFDLGGHSLLAARVFSELRKRFKVQLGLSDLFRAPTIAELADLIYERETESEHSDRLITLFSELEELSDEEARMRLSEELDGSAAFRI